MSRKSYWRLSKTYATQLGMNDAWLEKEGLTSISAIWSGVHHPKGPKVKPIVTQQEEINLWG